MEEKKPRVSASLKQPYDLKGSPPKILIDKVRSLSKQTRRRINLFLSVLLVTWATFLALTQEPRPNPYRPPANLWEQFTYPIERNAFLRLPQVPGNLNAVFALPDGDDVWAAGDSGFILHSPDGGRCWEQQWPTPGPLCAGTPTALAGWLPIGTAQAADAPQPADLKKAARPPTRDSAGYGDLGNDDAESLFDQTATLGAPAQPGAANQGVSGPEGGEIEKTSGNDLASVTDVHQVIQSIYFIDAQSGWAVGEEGTILATVDGGRSWNPQNSGSSNRLLSVTFVGAQRGWAVGSDGIVLATVDGGQIWEAQDSGSSSTLTSVSFVDSEHGWAVGSSGTILATVDGGQNWNIQASDIGNYLWSVFFLDSLRGWAVGSTGTILATIDGGQSWEAQDSGSSNTLTSVTFLDSQRGWAVGSTGTILTTADGGQSWEERISHTSSTLTSVTIIDGQRGWAVGWSGTVLATSDGGQLWELQTNGTSDDLWSVAFLESQHGWAVGGDGTLLATVDGGQTWEAQDSGTFSTLTSVTFLDGQRGWTVGSDGTLLATKDGGRNWAPQSSGTANDLWSVTFVDNGRGWAVGRGGTILTTVDGGQNWELSASGMLNELTSVSFPDNRIGWAVGTNGTILSTADGGQSWKTQRSGISNELISIALADVQHGWVVGVGGTLLMTEDGGRNWTPQNSGTANSLGSVTFVDSQRGWAVGDGGTILATVDGGQVWSSPMSPYRRLPAPVVYLLFCGALLFAFWPVRDGGPQQDSQRLKIQEEGHTDAPVASREEDRLDFWPVSHALSRFLRNPNTKPPLTVAVTGSWGSGKSSLMNMLREELVVSGVRPVWFNAWHHEGEEEHLLAALLQNIRSQGIPALLSFDAGRFIGLVFRMKLLVNRFKDRPLWALFLVVLLFLNAGYWAKTGEPAFVPSRETRNQLVTNCAKMLVPQELCGALSNGESQGQVRQEATKQESTTFDETGPAATTAAIKSADAARAPEGRGKNSQQKSGDGETNWFAWLLNIAGTGGVATLLSWLRVFGFSPAQLARQISGSGNRQIEKRMDYRQRFQQEFQTVTDALAPRTMLILIDDLDRCQPETVVKVLESINFLTSAGRCYVVLGMAREMVEPAVGLAFREIAEEIAHLKYPVGAATAVGLDAGDGVVKRREFAKEYLEKLINLEIPVPTADANLSREMVGGAKKFADGQQLGPRRFKHWQDRLIRATVIALFAFGAFWAGGQLPNQTSPKVVSVAGQQIGAEVVTEVPEVAPEPSARSFEEWPTLADKPVQSATFTPGEQSEAPLWIWLLAAAILLVISRRAITRVFKREDNIRKQAVVEDTEEFEHALTVWNPIIVQRLSTPRRLKRFMNRLRYIAVRINVLADVAEQESAHPPGLSEWDVVALSTLHLVHPDCIDLVLASESAQEFAEQLVEKNDWNSSDGVKEPAPELVATVVDVAHEIPNEKWRFDENKANLFRQFLTGIRVH